MSITIEALSGHYSAAIGWERWPGGLALFLGPWVLWARWR